MGEIHVLRIVHVVGGMFWVGSHLFNTVYLFPALMASGPAGGAIIGSMQRRHMFVVLPTIALLTILSGIRLMWITSGDFASAYFDSSRGLTFAISGGAAIIAFLIGMFVARPIGARIARLQNSMASAPEADRPRMAAEAERLQRRNGVIAPVVLVLLLIAAVGMAIGRYV